MNAITGRSKRSASFISRSAFRCRSPRGASARRASAPAPGGASRTPMRRCSSSRGALVPLRRRGAKPRRVGRPEAGGRAVVLGEPRPLPLRVLARAGGDALFRLVSRAPPGKRVRHLAVPDDLERLVRAGDAFAAIEQPARLTLQRARFEQRARAA